MLQDEPQARIHHQGGQLQLCALDEILLSKQDKGLLTQELWSFSLWSPPMVSFHVLRTCSHTADATMLHIPYSHHAYFSELLPPSCQFPHYTSHEAEVGYRERTFRHHPEARHGTGDKSEMKAWQAPGMQNKVWLHTGESMLHSSTSAWLLSLPLRHTRKQTTYRVATQRAETYSPFVQQDPTHFSEVVLWCTTGS